MKNCVLLKSNILFCTAGFIAGASIVGGAFAQSISYQNAVTYSINDNGVLTKDVSYKNLAYKSVRNESIKNESSKKEFVQSTEKISLQNTILKLRQDNIALKERIDVLVKERNALRERLSKIQEPITPVPRSHIKQSGAIGREQKMPIVSSQEAFNYTEMQEHVIGMDDLQKGQVEAYKHHAVYIFHSQTDQSRMWALLESVGEADRWQGVTSDKSRYFIYVGAYQERSEADARALQLNDIIGVTPIVYTQNT